MTTIADLLNALKVALPYVERVAATQPFEMNRQQRQRQAIADLVVIRAAIAEAERASA